MLDALEVLKRIVMPFGQGRSWVIRVVMMWVWMGGVVLELRAEERTQPEGAAQVMAHFKGLDEGTLKRMVQILVNLGEGKPETAAALFQDNAQKVLNPNSEFEADVRRTFSKLAGRLSFMQTVEYIGYARLSKNLSVALFALNSDYNVHYFGFSIARQGDAWRFEGYVWKADWEEMLRLKVGINEKPVVVWEFPRVGR